MSPASAPQFVTALTLGVRDVQASLAFYTRALGLPLVHHMPGEIAFVQSAPGQLLALWNIASMPGEYGEVGFSPDSAPPVSLGRNVASAGEVAPLIERALAAGATLVGPVTTREWGGTSGCVADPDGYRVDVVHNPAFSIGEYGSVTV
ncbi:MAG: VOC family protein [Arthrobacter sp.]|jgi:catechol 2,3-dioxygenase-like lactoylglutathione lyase family enzyme|nr:VOC family protein [Arthrobacter sp.]